ncbi:DUF2169 domain-containing protein [Bosea caraganae]|uniref:DUF2169 domain-containing protein n=1 Tax=Bosea caraganae TaxID=2763117 RepID=A0A370L0Y6_9HYPH|nr:DUF2169 domain-containing protein [Bosea caraganae]RDJ21038.1 DUF2169 domain-containing protein [Bosea caraganae]RDJ28537.1 DUF2169 domain-containing protein [Bosea caraganae]
MKLFSSLPYKFIPLDSTLDPAKPELSFIVKATFSLQNWRMPTTLPAEEQADFAGDERYMDEIGRSLRYASDLVPFKPFGEVLLTANCHAPDNYPAPSVDAGLTIGPISKHLRVFGDRVWLRDPQGQFMIEGPAPFIQMPLRWERAFGGLNLPENPMGRGIEPWTAEDGRKFLYLANIESPDLPIRGHDHLLPPACFAPISPNWQPRFGREGTRDQHWATFVAPLRPRDHDPRAAQAAPDDQCLKSGYWTGDERIELTNMHPDHASFTTALPGKRLRCFIEALTGEGEKLKFGEVPLDLDTVHIDMTSERLQLIWRQRFLPRLQGGSEIQAVYLAEELLTDEPASVAAHYQDYLKLKGPEPEANAVKLARDEQAALGDARKTLVDAKVDEAVIAKFDAAPTPDAKFAMLIELMQSKTAELEAMTASMKAR